MRSSFTDENCHQQDAADIERSNWLRWPNCPRDALEENVLSVYCYGRVFYRTMRDVEPGEELLVYYGDAYAQQLGIDYTLFKHHHKTTPRDEQQTTSCPSHCTCTCPEE